MIGIFDSKLLVSFDECGVSGALVSRGPRGPRIRACARVPLPAGALVPGALDDNVARPDALREALARVHGELGGDGRRAALILPDGTARIALLDIPTGVRPAEFARFRLAQGLAFAPGEALVDGMNAPPGRFLAAAVRRSVVRGYEAVAASAGFLQDRVDLLSLAALAPLLRRPERAFTALAVVLGDAAFSMAYFDAGRLLCFRNRRRDGLGGGYARLRDEIVRTAAVAGSAAAPRVVTLGSQAPALAAALVAEGLDASSGYSNGGGPGDAAWLAAAL